MGLLAGALFGGASAVNQINGANTLRSVANIYAGPDGQGVWQQINKNNNDTLKTLTGIGADASTDQTRWQTMGMIFNANTQYLQSVDYKVYMDRASRRAYFTERKQIAGESKMVTLAYNAEIHAADVEQVRELTKMEYDFQERVAAARSETATS